MCECVRENNDLNIDWNKFKSKVKGKHFEKAKKGYIEFCQMLDEVDFELVSDYTSNKDKVELVYKFDNNIKINKSSSDFKTYTYKSIVKIKNQLKENGDKFIKFVGLSGDGKLIVKIKTFDDGEIDIDIGNYNSFNKGRRDFYNKLKEINGDTSDWYRNDRAKIDVFIDGVRLNLTSIHDFKYQTYNNIIKFKENIIKNKDKFICFTDLTEGGTLIAKIKTFDGGETNVSMVSYSKFIKARQDFYNKLNEINGYTTDYYKNKDTKINIYIDDVKLNPMSVHGFKTQTYRNIINFKNKLINNGDEFIKFVGLVDKNTLIARIKTFDGGTVDVNINNYSQWIRGRQNTYNYCVSKGYEILSPYINSLNKILIDFNCGHEAHLILSNSLKKGHGCPTCSESKGEKSIRIYLENNNINFIQEYKFEDCKYKRSLPFDFYIRDYNLCIEFDGIQHFEIIERFGGEEKLKLTQKLDRIKNKFCKYNNINLLRIPYYELDEIDNILDEELCRLRKTA